MKIVKNRPHQLSRLATRVFDVPLAIEEGKLETILAVLGDRIGLETEAQDFGAPDHDAPPAASDIAVIRVYGSLVNRSLGINALSGLVSYDDIRKRFRAAMKSSASAILLDIDSPGGEASGVFDLSDEIRKARGKKPIWALINERGTSAAYAIASAADRIVMPRTATTASIGVIAAHVDVSEMDKELGRKWTFIRSAPRKAETNPHEPLSDKALAALQAEVDRVAGIFFSTMLANRRKLTQKVIDDLQGSVVHGEEAVRLGLVDSITPAAEAVEELRESARNRGRLFALLTPPQKSAHTSGDRNPRKSFAKNSGEKRMSLADKLNALIDARVTEDKDRDAVTAEVAAALDAAGLKADTLADLIAGKTTEVSDKALETIATALGAKIENLKAGEEPKAKTEPEARPKPGNVVNMDDIRKQGRAEATEIAQLCTLAGRPDLSAQFLADGLTPAQVRTKLCEMRAAGDELGITSMHPPQDRKDAGWDKALAAAGIPLKKT